MPFKYYAVKIGHAPGIYTSWSNAKEQVLNYSGCMYKGFNTREEALLYLNQTNYVKTTHNKYNLDIYTDGSHFKNNTQYNTPRYGAYCKYNNVEYIMSGICDSELCAYYECENTKISNPTAEFIAFAEVLRCFKETNKDLSHITLNFYIDYEGIHKWMSNQWRTKQSYTTAIKNKCDVFIAECGVKVNIEWVRGHSGNHGNTMADTLAKMNIKKNTFTVLCDLLQN